MRVRASGRYRYYVSRGLTIGPAHRVPDGWRLPATEFERTVVAAAQRMLADEPAIATAVEDAGVAAHRIPSILETTRDWNDKLRSNTEATALAALVHRVELSRDGLRLSLKVPMPVGPSVADGPPSPDAIITRFVPLQLKRRGVELRLVIPADHASRGVVLADPRPPLCESPAS